MPGWSEYRALDRRVWSLALARALNTMGLSLVMSFMAIYLVHERGLTATTTGVLLMIANVLQAISQGYAGELSDRIGRRKLMAGALYARSVVLGVLGALVLAGAPLSLVIAAVIAGGVLRGVFEPVAFAVVADVAGPGRRTAAFGLQKMGVNLGWAFGPALGGLLQRYLDYGWVFFCAVPVVLAAAWSIRNVADPVHSDERVERTSLRAAFAEARRRPEVALFLVGALGVGLVHTQLFSSFAIYASGAVALSEDRIGLLWTINAVLVIAFQLPAVALIERIGPGRALVLGTLIYAASFVAIGAAAGFGLLAAGIGVLTVAEVIVAPAQQTAAAELGDPRRMGRAMGLLGTMNMLGVAAGPLVGGVAYDNMAGQPLHMWGAILAISLLLAVLFAAFEWTRPRRAR